MTETMSFNFVASNDAGDYSNGQWQIDPNKYFTSDGTWITPPQEYVTDGTAGNIPWIMQDPNVIDIQPFTIGPITIAPVGTLRLNPTTGMIERWDGTNWAEYGKPLTPPPGIVEPPKPEDDFELGGAL